MEKLKQKIVLPKDPLRGNHFKLNKRKIEIKEMKENSQDVWRLDRKVV